MYLFPKQNAWDVLAAGLRAALARCSRPPLRALDISLHGQTLHFRSLRDFAFCLVARTSVPAARTASLLQRPAEALRAETWTLRTLENQLGGIIEDDERLGISCLRTLAPLGTRMFSKDHEWRAIFEQLVAAGPGREAYVRMALTKYLQYLAARREVIEFATALRAAGGQAGATADAGFAPDKATAVFDVADLAAPAAADKPLRRLPHGEAVRLSLSRGRSIEIRLAGHAFSLSRERDWCLSDRAGRRYPLHPGVNSVGRSRDNDIAVDADLHEVSRRHLLAQPLDPDAIELVDLSTAGTYVADDTAA